MSNSLIIPTGTLIETLPAMARLGAILLFVPVPGMRAIPAAARVLLVVSLGWMLGPRIPKIGIDRFSPITIAGSVAREAAMGVALGVVIAFMAETLVFAVQCIVMQAGFSYASTIDPNSEADSSVLQIFYQLFANMLFFTCGGDVLVLRAITQHLGNHSMAAPSSDTLVHSLIASGAVMMELGLRLAAPLAAFLFLCDLTLAVLGRVHSQLQLLSMGFPTKMLCALFLLAALGPMAVSIYQRALNQAASVMHQFSRWGLNHGQ
ncbi:MAG: flagellar biosynthetic protein FliR [Fimbriimonadaceae bacterium]|nr:flagellar biosynthetic protein FliR [Fimbriimonadaceae bacterium]